VIVPPENPQALVDAIVQLKDNRPLCLELGANGRRFAETTFARDRVLEQYQAFFETIDGQVRAGTRFFGSLAQPDE
jgi:putative colanic acid biosynthesis glycosyltransferase WcaI